MGEGDRREIESSKGGILGDIAGDRWEKRTGSMHNMGYRWGRI